MFCEKCGSKINEGHMFCTSCGAKRPEKEPVKVAEAASVSQSTDTQFGCNSTQNSGFIPEYEISQKKITKERKGISKGKLALIITVCALGLIIVVGAVFGVLYFTSDEQKIIRAMDNGEYDKAVSLYNESDGDMSVFFEGSIESRLEKIKDDFLKEEIEYEVANMELSTIEKMNLSSVSETLRSVRTFVSELNSSRTYFSTAESLFAQGDYANAIENYRMVIEEDSNYETAKNNLEAAVDELRSETLSSAEAFAGEGLYDKAISEIKTALNTISNDEELTKKLELYSKDFNEQIKETALAKAEEYSKDDDLENAICTIQGAIVDVGDDSKLMSALNSYTDNYVEKVIQSVDSLTKEKDYANAISVLNSAIKLLPDNEKLKDKLAIVEENKPVLLSSLTPINGGWNWNEGDPTDPFGVTYSNAGNFAIINGAWYGSECYSEYRLYGDYKILTGSLVSHADIPEKGYSQIKVFADDKLIYTSPKIERKTDLTDFSVNVSGADYIKILVYVETTEGYDDPGLVLMNCQLWKE